MRIAQIISVTIYVAANSYDMVCTGLEVIAV